MLVDTINFYRPQRSWGKVMFLHVCVILFTGECHPSMHCRWYPSMPYSRGVPGPRGGGLVPGGGWGVCSRGVPGPRGCGLLLWPSVVAFCYGLLVWWPSGLVAFWLKAASWYGLLGAEGHNRRPPHHKAPYQKAITEGGVPGGDNPPGMATAAGGTHPTGMHSCGW